MCSDLGPRCIGHSGRHGVMLFEWCKGKELSHFLDNTSAFGSALSDLAPVLSRLHHQRSSKLPRNSLAESDHHARQQLTYVACISEDLALETYHLARRQITNQFLPISQSVPIHGDLHLDQSWSIGSNVRLLDFWMNFHGLATLPEDLSAIYAGSSGIWLWKAETSTRHNRYTRNLLDSYARAGGSIE